MPLFNLCCEYSETFLLLAKYLYGETKEHVIREDETLKNFSRDLNAIEWEIVSVRFITLVLF